MSIVTVWTNSEFAVKLVQLSDNPQDGTAAEQISYLSTLDAYADYSCVDQNFTGSVPSGDAAQWRWSDGQIVSVPVVPVSVTPRQVRLLLLSQNLLSQVETIIAASDEATKITWQYANEFRRDNPLLTELAANLTPPLTSDQIDQFFINASKL